MSGLKMNFEKSELMMIIEDNIEQQYAEMFNCQQGNWPIKYLGVPISARRCTVQEMSVEG